MPSPTSAPTPTFTPTPKTLTVCLPDEPDSLYLYGETDSAAQHIWEAIYDGPVDNRTYAHQPILLTELPSFTAGAAVVETVTVHAGERVLTTKGEVIELAPGVPVENASNQHTIFDGDPISMQRMVVTFTLQHDLYWSDGALLTADDSVFSFELASDPASHTKKHIIERTADYRAPDVRTVVWKSVPGFLDQFCYLNFWHPLPRHAWGDFSAAELLNVTVSTRRPLGWGPFVISEWIPGDHLTVVRNPIYFRAYQGLPHLDEITFRFIPNPTTLAEELLVGRCDVATHEAAEAVRAALPDPPEVETLSVYDARWELMAFGISPAPDYERPDLFEDVRVRQGIAQCIDRQAIAEQVAKPPARVLHSYLPSEHPLYAGDELSVWEHDPVAGATLLGAAGWRDDDADGVREAHGIPNIPDDAPFQIVYHTTGSPLRVQTAQLIQTSLAECGIQLEVEILPPDTLFAPGPEGVLFGRRFDLAQFSWRAVPDPLCDLFLSSQIPDAGHWDRINFVGFIDDEYDTACQAAQATFSGSAEYAAQHATPQRIFSVQLPVLPLFQCPKTTLVSGSVTGLAPDPTQASELWNIEQVDLQP